VHVSSGALGQGENVDQRSVRIRSVSSASCRRQQLFFALAGAPALRSGSGIPQALAGLEAHRRGGRDLQAFAGPQVAAAAGAALIDLEAAEANQVHRLALADGSFDPGEHAPDDCLDHGLRLPGVGRDAFDQVSQKLL